MTGHKLYNKTKIYKDLVNVTLARVGNPQLMRHKLYNRTKLYKFRG